MDSSGGALGKATLASTTTPSPGRSPNNTWPRRTGRTASQGQVSGQIGPGLPSNPGRSGAGPRPTQTLEAQGLRHPRAKVCSGNSRWRSRSRPLLPVKSDPLRTPRSKPHASLHHTVEETEAQNQRGTPQPREAATSALVDCLEHVGSRQQSTANHTWPLAAREGMPRPTWGGQGQRGGGGGPGPPKPPAHQPQASETQF